LIVDPAWADLVKALREVVGGCRYHTLEELSLDVAGRPGKRRLSELIRGTGAFPERHLVESVVQACAPQKAVSILRLFDIAMAERSAQAQRPAATFRDVAIIGQVESFTDWTALGVHRPITQLQSGDLSGRVASGELPTYVPRVTDLDPDPATGLRATLAQARAR